MHTRKRTRTTKPLYFNVAIEQQDRAERALMLGLAALGVIAGLSWLLERWTVMW